MICLRVILISPFAEPEPSGFADSRQGLSECDTPGCLRKCSSTPGAGARDPHSRDLNALTQRPVSSGTSARCNGFVRVLTGGLRKLRPPATIWQPWRVGAGFGVQTVKGTSDY